MPSKDQYIKAIGRRKTSVARVRIWPSGSGFLVNDKKLEEYFPVMDHFQKASAPLRELKMLSKFKVSIMVSGGGINGQAEAISHGLSRALIKHDPKLKEQLKPFGFLTRDSRMKERKKPGLKRARKAPQFSKR